MSLEFEFQIERDVKSSRSAANRAVVLLIQPLSDTFSVEVMSAVQPNLLLSCIILITNRANLLALHLLLLHKGFVHATFGTKQQTFIDVLLSVLEIVRNSLSISSLSLNEVRVLPAIDQNKDEQKKQGGSSSDLNIKHSRIHPILHVLYFLILACLFRLTYLENSINAAIFPISMRVHWLTDFPTIITRSFRALQLLFDLLEPSILLHRRNHQRDRYYKVENRSNKEDLKGESALAKGRAPTHKLKLQYYKGKFEGRISKGLNRYTSVFGATNRTSVFCLHP